MVFDSARASVIGEGAGSVRALIVTGKDLKADGLPEARVTMSVPIVHTFSHPAVAAPLFATHPLDLQAFPASANASADSFGVMAHVGPPTVNIEAKLYGIHDAAVEGGMDPEGLLSVRGPAVAKVEVIGDHHDDETNKEGWLETGEKAKIMSNGCFRFST
jgi:long-chain acyl-CoA synthetase